mmetsp:Transcript_15197/g.37776  ORF Transcript_15197/g.37776 Transcript_15197/m.37776 type:complete len:220 (+) Transcript_15197:456-1115(+)
MMMPRIHSAIHPGMMVPLMQTVRTAVRAAPILLPPGILLLVSILLVVPPRRVLVESSCPKFSSASTTRSDSALEPAGSTCSTWRSTDVAAKMLGGASSMGRTAIRSSSGHQASWDALLRVQHVQVHATLQSSSCSSRPASCSRRDHRAQRGFQVPRRNSRRQHPRSTKVLREEVRKQSRVAREKVGQLAVVVALLLALFLLLVLLLAGLARLSFPRLRR